MAKRALNWLFGASLLLAVLTGGYLGLLRYWQEGGDRKVEVAVDLNDLKKIVPGRQALRAFLAELKNSGVTAVGVFEETLPLAVAQGRVYLAEGAAFRLQARGAPLLAIFPPPNLSEDKVYLYFLDDETAGRISGQLRLILGEEAVRAKGVWLEVSALPESLNNIGLGIPQSTRDYFNELGLKIVPRLVNDPRYGPASLKDKLALFSAEGVVVFDGEEVLGQPAFLSETADALRSNQLNYGYLEVVRQFGDQQLKKLMGEKVIRVHSISEKELKKLTSEEAIDRFARSVRERRVRLVYLRPFLPPQSGADPLAFNRDYFRRVISRIEADKFIPGSSDNPAVLSSAPWQVFFLGLGVLAGALILFQLFYPLTPWLAALGWLAGALALGLMAAFAPLFWLQKFLALLTALIFPTYAVISSFTQSGRGEKKSWLAVSGLVLNVLAETFVGIFILIGLLADQRFLSGAEVFPGVKLALTLPLLLVAVYFLVFAGEGNWRSRLEEFFQSRLSVRWLIWCGLGGILLLLMLARSDNFVIPVPALEKQLRGWLELIFYVRPRTKEFLIGYPALLLAFTLFSYGVWRRWFWLVVAVGTLAPVSVMNTFSHAHTPLLISLLRTFHGLIIGFVLAWLVAGLAERFLFREGEK